MDNLTREINFNVQWDIGVRDCSLTQAELDALMKRRKRERTEHWTALERFVRVPLLKLRGRV